MFSHEVILCINKAEQDNSESFHRTETLEIYLEAADCGSGWVDWDILGWDWIFLVTTLNSLRIQTSYKEKPIWCAWPGKVALPFILKAASTSSGVGCRFTESLWPLFPRPRISDTCTHTHLLTWEITIVEIQHCCVCLFQIQTFVKATSPLQQKQPGNIYWVLPIGHICPFSLKHLISIISISQSSGQPWEGVTPIFQMKLRDVKELL